MSVTYRVPNALAEISCDVAPATVEYPLPFVESQFAAFAPHSAASIDQKPSKMSNFPVPFELSPVILFP